MNELLILSMVFIVSSGIYATNKFLKSRKREWGE